ncbi:MAG: fused MFS/spermidine synthase [Planctomycetota bacterium]
MPLVFLSGASALVYEIVWARHLSLVLGSSKDATAAVLSAFMLGLALGALFVGKYVDQAKRPLRWAAWLEFGLAGYAVVFPSILDAAGDVIPGGAWIRAFALLVVPCVLMGATLPVLARAGAETPSDGAKVLGTLYGVNTLGAVAGSLFTTFFLLETFGMRGATWIGAGGNVLIGLIFLLASARAGERVTTAPRPEPDRGAFGSAGGPVMSAFFLAGFAGLALEVAWVRVLVYFLEGFTIAFGLMLSTYLLGLGLGSVLGTRLASASRNPRRLLARLFFIEAVLALGTFLLSDKLYEPLESMKSTLGAADAMGARYAFGLFAASAAIILPATLAAGALFPVVAKLALCTPQEIGRQGGAVYAASTLGAVIAPPAAAFLLIPLVGVPGTIVAASLLLVIAGAIVAVKVGRREVVFAAILIGAIGTVSVAAGLDQPLVTQSAVLRNEKYPRRLVEFHEGRHCGVSVVEDLPSGTLSLYVDDFRAAETGPQYGYMRMLGHLPALLHKAPKRALVIAFGTGTTAGALTEHPEIEELVCVEIEEAVFDVADHFADQNRGVLKRQNTTAVVADGREYLRRDGPGFDLITLEPLMPYTPAAVYLYTQEFYETAARRLNPGGLLCQWIPIHAQSSEDFKRLLKAMTEAMPHVSLWFFEESAVVVGAAEPPQFDYESFARRCEQPGVQKDLRHAFVGGAVEVLAAHVVSDRLLRKELEDVEPMRDDKTVLEFRPLPRRFGKRSYRFRTESLQFLDRVRDNKIRWLPHMTTGFETELALAKCGQSALLTFLSRESESRLDRRAWRGGVPSRSLQEAQPHSLFARYVNERRLYAEYLGQGLLREAAALTLAPDRSQAFEALALQASGEERKELTILALGQQRRNTRRPFIDVGLLEELAAQLTGEEQRYVQIRLDYLAGKELPLGLVGRRPVPVVPDLKPLLHGGKLKEAKAALQRAHSAGEAAVDQAEAQIEAYLRGADDRVRAALALSEIGSRHALRALLKARLVAGPADLVKLAPAVFRTSLSDWKTLCAHKDAAVRDAAAGAAGEHLDAGHWSTVMGQLVVMLGDESQAVRLSAITAIVRHEWRAQVCYTELDRKPTANELGSLKRILSLQ